jgi:hypothetical protein
MQQQNRHTPSSLAAWLAGFVTASIFLTSNGCRPAGPRVGGPGFAGQTVLPDAPKGAAVADPVLREAREQADAILSGLLAGKFDNDPELSLVARKVKGFQSSSIKFQEIVREGTVNFRGLLISPAGGQAGFEMTLVKQTSGKWAVGTFSGPQLEGYE